jgi:hypothetical protein
MIRFAQNKIALPAAHRTDHSPPDTFSGKMDCGFPSDNAKTFPGNSGHAS